MIVPWTALRCALVYWYISHSGLSLNVILLEERKLIRPKWDISQLHLNISQVSVAKYVAPVQKAALSWRKMLVSVTSNIEVNARTELKITTSDSWQSFSGVVFYNKWGDSLKF